MQTLMMAVPIAMLPFLPLLILQATSATAAPAVWQGTMSYPCVNSCDGVSWLVKDGPITLTLDAGTASVDWTWTVLPNPGHPVGHCLPKHEAELKVESPAAGKAGKWFAKGNGGETQFYSLEATLSEDGGALVDGVIYFAKNGTWPGTAAGTFVAQKGAPRANGTCVPPPPSPPSPPPAPAGPTLWPLPANHTFGTTAISLAAAFAIACDGSAGCGANTLLQTAFRRYTQQIFAEHGGSDSSDGSDDGAQPLQLGALVVHVGSADERKTLQLGMDESYSLEVGRTRSAGGELQATLSAPAVWGVLRGLETFTQLVRWDWDNHSHVIRSAPWMIEDKPRFPHRAFMIDTARHFQPLAVFGRLLDGMAACKLNTLHWHISDAQSVAFESAKYPKVWEGRWSEDERYSHADIAWVVEQARLRGVRVELELDFPAHASSFCVGYPQLCANVPNGEDYGGHCGLDVSKNFTFEFVDGLVAELGTPAGGAGGGGGTKQALFFEDFFHFGGDEVDTRCWGPPPGTNANISGNYGVDLQIWSWLKANGNLSTVGYRDMGSYNPTTMQHYLQEALGYFYQRLDAIAISHGKTPVHWSVENQQHYSTYRHCVRSRAPLVVVVVCVCVWGGVQPSLL